MITGAAKRLGRATALEFAQHNCNLILHYHQSEVAAQDLYQELNKIRPRSCVLVQANLEKPESYPQIVKQSLSAFGRIDHLINNASAFYPTPFLNDLTELKPEDSTSTFLKLLQTNFLAAKNLIFAFAPDLSRNNGSVVNLIDIYADAGLQEHTFYVASKAALKGSIQQMANLLAPRIRVNGVSPGAILWPDTESGSNMPDSKTKQKIIAHTALKHLGTPENIAATIRFLALEAHYVTGTTINVDGGRRDYL